MIRKLSLLALNLFWCSFLWSQLILQVTSIPANTPDEFTIYAAGNFNAWDPGNGSYTLDEVSDGVYQISLDLSPGSYQYKFTRGSWATVEGNENGGFRPNRVVQYSGGEQIEELQILSWEDVGGNNSTAADNVSIIATDFYIPQLDRTRRIWLYLPPDYETSAKYYPVLYMHDGQNVFDVATSFAGEWEVDESLNALFDEGDQGIIVVAIDNGGANRIDEYSPWINPTYGGGQGDEYVDFIIETLKPHIDENYRTRPGREYTGIMGSSLGGLISFYAAIEHQDVFGKAGVFSPSFWFSNQVYAHASATGKQHDMKIYMIAGEEEGASVVANMLAMHTTLLNAGFTEDELFTISHPDGQHSEWYWRREFPDAYIWLFSESGPTATETEISAPHIRLIPNPAGETLRIETSEPLTAPTIEIFSVDGRLIQPRTVLQGSEFNVSFMQPGIYIFNIFSEDRLMTSQKIVVSK
jgi:predicted alpha/beta superfamily hydrolase